MTSFQPEDLILYSSVSQSYALSQNVLQRYRTDWNNFERIQAFNSNISTQIGQGKPSKPYYTYVDYIEKNSFKNGQYLHILYIPNSNWDVVQKN